MLTVRWFIFWNFVALRTIFSPCNCWVESVTSWTDETVSTSSKFIERWFMYSFTNLGALLPSIKVNVQFITMTYVFIPSATEVMTKAWSFTFSLNGMWIKSCSSQSLSRKVSLALPSKELFLFTANTFEIGFFCDWLRHSMESVLMYSYRSICCRKLSEATMNG